jgi:LysR family transcriptional regulator, nitrogen assimilation regulatory protein
MNLDHLRTFARAAELGSFTRAADALGLAQPTVSRIVAELEAEWNGALFHRTGHGVVLTENGREALKKVQTLLGDVAQISEDMRSLGHSPSGSVAIALPPSLILSFLPALINRLRRDRPGIRLRIYEGFAEQVERWLSDGIVDVGLYSEYHIDSKYHESRHSELLRMSAARVVLVGPAGAGGLPREIDFERLADYPLVLPAPSNGMRALVDNLAKKMALTLDIVAEADSVVAQEALTLQCGCFMLRGENAIAAERRDRDFAICTVKNPTIHRRLLLSTLQARPLSRAAREVASMVTSMLRNS